MVRLSDASLLPDGCVQLRAKILLRMRHDDYPALLRMREDAMGSLDAAEPPAGTPELANQVGAAHVNDGGVCTVCTACHQPPDSPGAKHEVSAIQAPRAPTRAKIVAAIRSSRISRA
jgi:hypothetical protein